MTQKNKLAHIDLIERFLFQEIEMYFAISTKTIKFWEELNNNVECFVFGGFINDFLNHNNKHRDIDIVISYLNPETLELINNHQGIRNSFGGYKLNIDGINIDIWAIKDTWVIKKMNYLDFDLINLLPSTSFFNSTAIIYSIREKSIHYHNKFVEYLNNNKLDILFEDNPFPALCILKSYQYYKEGFHFTSKLNTYIFKRFNIYFDRLEGMQLKHYGNIKYTHNELLDFFNDISLNLNQNKRNKRNKKNQGQLILF